MLWKLNNCQKFELERSALPDAEPATFPVPFKELSMCLQRRDLWLRDQEVGISETMT
jgi:hypothetical protein